MKISKLIFSLLISSIFSIGVSAQTTETFTTSGSWTVPAGVTSVTVECWGAGGGGASIENGTGGGGGGGGAYASSIITVSPGQTYNFTVGTGGTPGNAGGNTSFDGTVVVATGGSGATGNTGGSGGTGSTGTTTYIGGTGGTGQTGGGRKPGGGGGGAGSTGAGGTGGNPDGGLGATLNGGDGGSGAKTTVNGENGLIYGGGGGGSDGSTGSIGGNGAGGLITFTYTAVASNCPSSTAIAPSTAQSHCVGDAANTLSATITTSGGSGTPTLLYQWYYNTTNSNTVTGATKIVGATSQTYTPPTTSSDIGDRWYFCVGYATDNGCGQTDATQSLASNAVQVTVNAIPATPTISSDGATTFCDGGSVNLTSSATTGTYLWSTSETTQTINVTTGGSYTVQITENGCQSAASAATVVTVNPNPAKPTITAGGATTFCNGGSVDLSSSASAGTYLWSTSETTQTITVNTSGSYTVQIIENGCTSVASDATTVTVNDVLPAGAVSGPTTVANGSSNIYSVTAQAGATNYTWTVPTGWTITGGQGTNSITATAGSSGGDVTVYITNACGDGPTSSLAVTIGSVPDCPTSNALADNTTQTVCEGTAVNPLTDNITSSGGDGTYTAQYQWYYNTTNSNTISGATKIAGASSASYTPLSTGAEAGDRRYFCVGYATDNGCAQTDADQSLASDAAQVTVNPNPGAVGAISGQATVAPSFAGYVYSISAVANATSYIWTVPTGWTITGGQGTTSLTVTSGTLGQNGNITVDASNACGTTSNSLAVTVSDLTDHSTISCASCHDFHGAPGTNLTIAADNANVCMSCHTSTGMASSTPFTAADAAVPGISGNSHAWAVAAVNGALETNTPSNADMAVRLPGGNIICSTCHDQHSGNTNPFYLRADNTADAICKDCHSARNVGTYATDNVNNRGSHPIGLAYNGADDRFNASPTNTTLVGGNIECSSCHQTHYATTNDGYILRASNDNNLCKDCHTYGDHNGFSCKDCHQTHNPVKDNIYMVKDVVNSNTVNFYAETGANSFADADATYDGICEVCHTATTYHLADGSGASHNPGSNCTDCHPHNANFTPSGGCTDCHIATFPNWGTADGHFAHTSKYSFACSTCHFQYGSGGALEASHPSGGAANVNFDPNGLTTRNGQDTNTPAWGGTTCSNIYCHSDGRSAYRGTDGTYTWSGTTGSQTPTYQTIPAWSSPVGTINTCYSCHPGEGNMDAPYTIDDQNDGTPNPFPTGGTVIVHPATGSHGPNRGAHQSNSQEYKNTAWDDVQCFWCHNRNGADPQGTGNLQGTYGTVKHVDGETYFDPRAYENSGTILPGIPPEVFSYALAGSAGHCGSGKTCW